MFDTIISMYQMLLHTRLGLLLDAAARRPLPAPRPPPRPRAKPRLSLRARSSSSSLPWRARALARLPCPSRVCPLLPSRPTRAPTHGCASLLLDGAGWRQTQQHGFQGHRARRSRARRQSPVDRALAESATGTKRIDQARRRGPRVSTSAAPTNRRQKDRIDRIEQRPTR